MMREPRGAECQCSPCGRTFSGLGLFTRHQDVDYSRRPAVRCLDPAALGMAQSAEGIWCTPAGLAKRESFDTAMQTAHSARAAQSP